MQACALAGALHGLALLAGSAYRRAPAGGFVCDVSVAEKP